MVRRILLTVIILLSNYSYSRGCELRATINNIEDACLQLQNLGAMHQGEYAFTDYMYQPYGKKIDLDKEYIRLRVYSKTQWNQKNYVIVHKIKEEAGKSGKVIWRQECDSFEQSAGV